MLPPWLLRDGREIEDVSRRNSRATYLGNGIVLARVLGTYLMYLDGFSTAAGALPRNGRLLESWITAAMAPMLQRGWWCMDIGANHGYYTLLMADAWAPRAMWQRVEPFRDAAPLLDWTVGANGSATWSRSVAGPARTSTGPRRVLVVPSHLVGMRRCFDCPRGPTQSPTSRPSRSTA